MDCYERLCKAWISHDAAGYATPQGLRNAHDLAENLETQRTRQIPRDKFLLLAFC